MERESGKLEAREDFVCAKIGVAVVSLEIPHMCEHYQCELL